MLNVTNVIKNSPADKIGIKPGDILLNINNETCTDFIDYEFLTSVSNLSVKYKNTKGKIVTKKVRKPEHEDFGIEFPTCKCRSCCNKCIFCFIDQLPDGLRDSLYFKDDDWRMSFLMGNYVTLTNVGNREFERILKRKTSPLYISVHATDPEVRSFILGNKNAEILPRLKKLAENGIYFDCQAVLVPGINDGDVLYKTISDLSSLYPYARSLALVPVGLTEHRNNLYPILPFTEHQAKKVIEIANKFSSKLLKELGTRFVFPADEMYIRANMELPPLNEYEELLQKEDGVGMISSFLHEIGIALNSDYLKPKYKNLSIACGQDIYPYFNDIAKKIQATLGSEIHVYPITNNYFGKTITISGLITGQDLIAQLKNKELGEELFISQTMLRQFEDVFLDDVTLSDLCDILNIKVSVVEPDGFEFIEKITLTED